MVVPHIVRYVVLQWMSVLGRVMTGGGPMQ